MKRRLSPLYALIPVLYVLVILALLYAQFSSRERFSQTVGSLTFSGVRAKGNLFSRQALEEVSLRYDLVELPFSSRRPLLLLTASGEEMRPALQACTVLAQGVQVQFERGIRLQFLLEGEHGDRVRIEPHLPDLGVEISSLSFPLHLREGKAESVEGLPLLSVSRRLFVSLPYDSSFDASSQRLSLPNRPGGMSLVLEPVAQGEEDPYLHWFGRDGSLADEAGFQEGVSAWLDRAYGAWKTRALAPGEYPARPEEMGAVFLSEALKRGEYPQVRVPFYQHLLQQKQADPRLQAPLLTTPYVGALDQYYQLLQGSIPRRLEGITALIRRGDPAVLGTPDLLRFIMNHGPFSLTEEVIRLADGVDLAAAPLPLVLSAADVYVEAGRLIGPAGSLSPRLAALAGKRLLPAIRRAGQGLYLQAEGAVDVRHSLAAGRLLLELGETGGREALVPIGRSLILSALRHADARGTLPARLTLEEDGAGGPEGRVAPEEVYARIVHPRYLPHEVPLYSQLGPGAWVWTASSEVTAEVGAASSRFTFSFPVGATHYVLLQGIKPFQTLRLHGLAWKTDPGYYRYSDGWVYDAATQTLFLKLTHREEVEELLVAGP